MSWTFCDIEQVKIYDLLFLPKGMLLVVKQNDRIWTEGVIGGGLAI